MSSNFPKRQVHLDFHTSPDIKGIGSRFDKAQFQAALREGEVSSITVFAKCHHGYCYYPTAVGTMHPELDFDFTGAMVDAAHEIGVNAPIYITAGWSHIDFCDHPEWISRDKEGNPMATVYDFSADSEKKKPYNSWVHLCLNDGAYCRHIYELTEEVCKRYSDIDGLFYDICFAAPPCYCDECVKGMKEMGLNPDCESDAKEYYKIKHISFMKKCGEILRKYHKDATIFFNSGGANPYKPEYHPHSTHYEMEDLPTAWGGYNKMPIRAKYFSNLGKDYLGMTGKFHLDWGEFGGFKSGEALKYEVSTMATFGAGCSIGDHMFPDGEMDMETYKNIGTAYKYLKKIEPYCYDGKSCANLGVYFSSLSDANAGLSNILLENQIDFDVIFNNNFSSYDAVIIPEGSVLDADAEEKLIEYTEKGGKVLFCGDALIKDGKPIIDCGLKYIDSPQYENDYILPFDTLSGELPRSPFLCYLPAMRATAFDAEIFAAVAEPQFRRTYAHFCGHKNTPYYKDGERYPAIAKKGNIVYMAHKIPTVYNLYGSLYHKRYFISALKLIYNEQPLKLDIGAQGRCTMIKQEDKNRYCINMVYASPVKRGAAEVIEDILPIYDIDICLCVPEVVKNITVLNTGEKLSFEQNGGECSFVLPKLLCHETVIIEY